MFSFPFHQLSQKFFTLKFILFHDSIFEILNYVWKTEFWSVIIFRAFFALKTLLIFINSQFIYSIVKLFVSVNVMTYYDAWSQTLNLPDKHQDLFKCIDSERYNTGKLSTQCIKILIIFERSNTKLTFHGVVITWNINYHFKYRLSIININLFSLLKRTIL